MDNYLELAKQYLARKESMKVDCMKLICNPDYTDIDSKWTGEQLISKKKECKKERK